MRRLILLACLLLASPALAQYNPSTDSVAVGRSAANKAQLHGASTGTPPGIATSGADSAVGFDFQMQGGGQLTVGGVPVVLVPTGLTQLGLGPTTMASQPSNAIAVTGGLAPKLDRILHSGIDPSQHLLQCAAAIRATGSCTVAVFGDSRVFTNASGVLAGSAPNPPTPLDFLYEMIKREMRLQNPAGTVNFVNDGIPGSTWADWSGVSSQAAQPWCSPCTAPLMSYVAAQTPDLVIGVLGANDGYAFSSTAMATALGAINGWSKIPSIVLAPTEPLSNDPTYGRSAAWMQNGFASVAGYTRSLALSGAHISMWGLTHLPQIGLLDFGRLAWITQRGIDPEDQVMTQVVCASGCAITGPVTGIPATTAYFLPQASGGDFDYQFRCVGCGATFFSNVSSILVNFGTIHSNAGTGIASNQFALITNAAAGGHNWAVQYYSGDSGIGTFGPLQGVPVPTSGDVVLRVSCSGAYCQVYANGSPIYDQPVVRATGPQTPSFSFGGSGLGSVSIQLDNYSVGVPRTYLASTTPDIAYNPNHLEGGGDVGAHPNDDGLHSLYWTTLEAQNFSLSQAVHSLSSYTVGPTTGQTLTMPRGTGYAFLTPGGTLASLTVTLPPDPIDGDAFKLVASAAVTALTVAGSGSASIVGAPSALGAFVGHEWRYQASSHAWVLFN